MKIPKWRKSLAVRLPRELVEVLARMEGEERKITVAGSGGISTGKEQDLQARLDSLRNLRGRLPADFRFDRDEASSRG